MATNCGAKLLLAASVLVSVCLVGSLAQENECLVRYSQSGGSTSIQVKDQMVLVKNQQDWTAFLTSGDSTTKFSRTNLTASTEISDEDKQQLESIKSQTSEGSKGTRWSFAGGRLMIESTDDASMTLRSNETGTVTLNSANSLAALNLANQNLTHVLVLNGSIVVLVDKECAQIEVTSMDKVSPEVRSLIEQQESSSSEDQEDKPHHGPPPHFGPHPPHPPHPRPHPPPPPHHGPHPPPPPPHHGPHHGPHPRPPPPPPPHHGPASRFQ